MAVSNGQKVDATVTNAAYLSRLQDSDTIGKQGFLNTDPVSGDPVLNIQRAVNETFDTVGMTGEGDATRKDYLTNNILANGDSHKVALGKVDAKFDSTNGHKHKGIAGDGPKIDAADLANINLYFTEFQGVSKTGVSGLTVNVNTEMSGRFAGGGASSEGVIVTYPLNKVFLIDSSTNTFLEDAGGQRIYGRLDYSLPNWTLSFWTNEAGVETAHNLASTNITMMFREVFTQFTRPTIPSNPLEFGTLDVTADVVDATQTQRGLVSTLTQFFAGIKTWVNTTQASSTTIAAQIFSGGVGIAKKLFVGEQINSGSFSGVAMALASNTSKDIVESGATVAELNYLSGLTGNVQTQLDNRLMQDTVSVNAVNAGTLPLASVYFINIEVIGSGGPVVMDAVPFGTTAPDWDSAEIVLTGRSDTDTVKILFNDAAKGCLLNGDCILYRGSVLKLKYSPALDRYVEISRNQLGV